MDTIIRRGFFVDTHKWGRVWKGYIESELDRDFTFLSNFHYAYCDGELDPENKLIWTLAASTLPSYARCISEAHAVALLLNKRWNSLETEGWEEDIATHIIGGILYDHPERFTGSLLDDIHVSALAVQHERSELLGLRNSMSSRLAKCKLLAKSAMTNLAVIKEPGSIEDSQEAHTIAINALYEIERTS